MGKQPALRGLPTSLHMTSPSALPGSARGLLQTQIREGHDVQTFTHQNM